MRVLNDYPKTTSYLSEKLHGAQLDTFRVSSLVLDLAFLARTDAGLQERWLSLSCDVSLSLGDRVLRQRADVVGGLYELIGQKVQTIEIGQPGRLSIRLGDAVLTTQTDSDPLEVIWSVTPENPNIWDDHVWSVSYTDDLNLGLFEAD